MGKTHFTSYLFLLAAQPALCQSSDWSNAGSATWSSAANWASGAIANGADADADFSTPKLSSNATVTLDADRTAGNLVFGNAASNFQWFLRSGKGGKLTLDVTRGMPQIQVNNGITTVDVEVAGTDGLAKNGVGTLLLSAANNYTGATSINQGTVRLGLPPVFPTNLKLMALGDSITYGAGGSNAGYRGSLYQFLNPLIPSLQILGVSTSGPGSLPSNQQLHAGHPSYDTQDVSNNLDGLDTTRFVLHGGADRDPRGGHWLVGGNGTGRDPLFPDVITMMIGTNELYLPLTASWESRLTALLTKLTTLRPNAKIFVPRITPITAAQNYFPVPQVALYNTVLSSVVSTFQAAGKNIYALDLNTAYPVNAFGDGVHPNDTGYDWMARQWYEAIITAYTPAVGISRAIPSESAVTIAQAGTLDLHGNEATTGPLTNSGILDLGNNGILKTAVVTNLPTGKIQGSGTFTGSVTHTGTSLGVSGVNLKFSGPFINNSTIDTKTGANLHFSGAMTNNGTLMVSTEHPVTITGTVDNQATIRIIKGASLNGGGTLNNNGLLDIMTGVQTLKIKVVNTGVILDSSLVKTKATHMTASTVSAVIQGDAGHLYQLQYCPTLVGDSWQNVGPAQDTPGGDLTFSMPRVAGAQQGCYRIKFAR